MANRLAWPLRGVTNKTSFLDTIAGWCPPPNLQNVRVHDVGSDRERFSPRGGSTRLSNQRLGPTARSFVQGLAVVSQSSSITGYTYGDGENVTGGTSVDGTSIINATDPTFLKYNAYIIAPDRGLRASLNELGQDNSALNDDHASEPIYGPQGAFACAWSPDGQYAYHLSLFPLNAGTPYIIWSITKHTKDGAVETDFGSHPSVNEDGYSHWGNYPAVGGTVEGDSYPNQILATNEYLFIAAGRYIYVMGVTDGARLQRFDCGWATEVMSMAIRPDGRLVACFAGRAGLIGSITPGTAAMATSPTTIGSGTDRSNGFYWRAGLALMDVTGGLVEEDSTVLALTQYGAKRTDTASADYEDHKTFRFAERSGLLPGFGCIPNSLTAMPDGSVIVGRTNRGWGRQDANKPIDTQPLVSILRISPGTTGATVLWERDVGSILETTTWASTTTRCDIPVLADTTGVSPRSNIISDPHPTIDAVVGNSSDGLHFYAAGRRTGANFPNNLYRIRIADGQVVTATNIDPTDVGFTQEHWINQNCAAYNELDNTLVVCGKRKDEAADTAHLWILDGVTMELVKEWDLGFSVDAYSVAVSIEGNILYTTGKAELP